MDLVDGEEGRLETLFRYSKQWGTMLAAELLQVVYILGWMLLFIIPGLIAAYRYSLTSYILAENPEMTRMMPLPVPGAVKGNNGGCSA